MRAGYALLLPAVLLLASCSEVPSVTQVAMPVGATTTITITTYRWFAGSLVPIGGVGVYSSNLSVLTVEQDPTLVSTSVTLHAWRPGTAFIKSGTNGQLLVTVTVEDGCTPVSVQPANQLVQAFIGSLVELRVIPYGYHPIGTTWYEPSASGWTPITPPATGNVYTFKATASGTFNFMARYSDRCGDASAILTVVVASTPLVKASVTAATMIPGESLNITITRFASVGGQIVPAGGAEVVSSNPGVLRLEQDPTLQSTSVTLHALQPGNASIQTADLSQSLVAVHVESCSPVSTRPQTTQVQTLVGSPVELRVVTDDPTIVATWYEEKGGAWSPIPFGTGNVYPFRPMVSGTFRFLVRYSDHCDDVSTLITVVASTRGHASRH